MISTLLKSPVINRLNSPTIHRLPNGLTIVVEQMPVEAVNLNLWNPIGSAIEANEINGMAHFLEHMIFKGTQQLLSGEFERKIEERGAVTNAATSQDYTHYYITTAPKDFAELAPLQMDVVLNPTIPDEAFEKERLVVLEEIRRSQDNPRRRTYYRAMELAFNHLPYRRPVLGPVEVISSLTPQQMRDFHTRWYQPESLTAVAVGNLPVEEMIEIIAEGFTHIKPQGREKISRSQMPQPLEMLTPEPNFQEIVRQEIVDETLQQSRMVMLWRVPGLLDLDQTYPLDVLASILGAGRTSRMIKDLREDRGLISSISVSNINHRIQGLFYISVDLPTENLDIVEAAIAQHIRTLHQEFVTEAEITRIRTQVANRFIFGNETPSDRANLYGYYQSMLGDLAPALNYPQHIQSVQPVDIREAVQKYLSPDAYGVSIVRPKAN
jgi:predicted Zn-dependent peptidase